MVTSNVVMFYATYSDDGGRVMLLMVRLMIFLFGML
jgi:hypothetical protein